MTLHLCKKPDINEHTIRKYHRGFENENKVKQESKTCQDILRTSKNKRAKTLRNKLASCTDDEPCNSLACPKCVRQKRLHFIDTALSALWEDRINLVLVTYIPYEQEFKLKDPATIDINFIKDKLRCYLKNAGIDQIAIGCFEMDYDMNRSSLIPHIHLITKTIDKAKLKKLRGMININHLRTRNDVKNRPLHVQDIYDLIGAIAYMYKVMWQAKSKKSNTKIKLHKSRLEDDLTVYSLLMLDDYSMNDIEFRYGVRRNKNGLSINKSHSAE